MLTTFKLVFGALIVISSLLFFMSPLIVSCFMVMVCIVSYIINRKYFQTRDKNDRQIPRALNSRSVTSFTSANVKQNLNNRLIKNARRRIAPQNSISFNPNDSVINWNKWPKVDDNRPVFNEMNSYSSTSSQPRPQSSQLSYQFASYGSKDNSFSRISPLSQLGNIRRVKLTPIETSHQRLNLNSRGVAVKIGSIPVNMSSTLNRLSNLSQTRSTFAANERAINPMPAQSQVIEALKEKRKRTQRDAIESEDSYEESNKRAKRDVSNIAFNVPNGLLASSKSSTKRASVIPNVTSPKRVRNNEILSSYSSMNSPNTDHNSKRKLSPNTADKIVVKTMRNESPDSSMVDLLSQINNESITSTNDEMDYNIVKLSENKKLTEEEEHQNNKISYGLPYHLHSMEDHERDKNKARNRLSRYLTAIQEATSPLKEDKDVKAIDETDSLNVTQTSDVSLPSVPAPAIFTSPRVETSVITTTTLLNTPISSVSTFSSNRGLIAPQVSVQNQVQSDTKATNNDYLNEESMSSSPTIISNEMAAKPPLFDIPITSSPLFSSDVKTTDNSKVSSQQSQSFTFSQPISSIKFGGLTNDTNLFNAPSIPPLTTTVSSLSLPKISSSQLQIPQFSSSAPLQPLQPLQPLANIKTTAMPAFNANTNSMTTFPLMQPNANFLSTEAQPSNQLFSLGVSSSRRTAVPRRTRSRR